MLKYQFVKSKNYLIKECDDGAILSYAYKIAQNCTQSVCGVQRTKMRIFYY